MELEDALAQLFKICRNAFAQSFFDYRRSCGHAAFGLGGH